MIAFRPLRTKRLDLSLRELGIRDAILLAEFDPDAHEAATAAMLPMIIEEARGEHTDPRRWTVQERMLVVAHYFSHVHEGPEGPNFPIGGGHFLDYLQGDVDYPADQVVLGEAAGDTWHMRQLLGAEAEALEPLCSRRLDWLLGDMAIRLVRADKEDERPDAATQHGPFSDWLRARMDLFGRLGESDFSDLLLLYHEGLRRLHHLFAIELDDKGLQVLPAKEAGPGAQALGPARFPVSACPSELAKRLRF